MRHVPQPELGRYKRWELSDAYEHGYHYVDEHELGPLLARFEKEVGDTETREGAERLAAMLRGAADAVQALAGKQREMVPLLRRAEEAERRYAREQ